MLGATTPQGSDMPGTFLIVVGIFFAIALLGLGSAIVYQLRAWRQRRMMRGDR